jgi:ATP-dependent Zn protease
MDAKEKAFNAQHTEHYHAKIDTALEHWMNEGEKNATSLVNEHWSTIDNLSKLLLEKEIIYEDELDEILAR